MKNKEKIIRDKDAENPIEKINDAYNEEGQTSPDKKPGEKEANKQLKEEMENREEK